MHTSDIGPVRVPFLLNEILREDVRIINNSKEALHLASTYNSIFESRLFFLLGSPTTEPSKDTTSTSIQNESIL